MHRHLGESEKALASILPGEIPYRKVTPPNRHQLRKEEEDRDAHRRDDTDHNTFIYARA
jgi:hypothetical protein